LVQVQSEDYFKVRKKFKTKLIAEKHAPSRIDSMCKPPADVAVIDFYSGDLYKNEPLTLKAWTNKPKTGDKKKYPIVIYLHGGFFFETEDWNMTKPFRDSGFVVVAPILRGEDGQKGVFSLFYDEVNDVIALAQYLREQPYVDKNRIYLSGHSVGGTLTLLAAQCSKLFTKAASFSGSPDQVIYCKYGFPSKFIPFDTLNVKEFEVRSPLSYAGSFKCPVRLYYGTREPHFHLSTLQTVKEAKKKSLDVESIRVEGGHEDTVPEEMKRAIRFFNEK
jgi:dipeptidyl aminopeptidase/acylaminoacyl peptidase